MPEIKLLTDRDTYIDEVAPDTNYGSSEYLVLDESLIDPRSRHCFLHFPISTIPPGIKINSALLYMYVYIARPHNDNYIQVPDNDWEENVLTWNNKPYPWGGFEGISCNFEGWNSGNITELVNCWHKNDFYGDPFPNYGLWIGPEYVEWVDGAAVFYSREKEGFEPYIIIDYGRKSRSYII